MPALHWHWIHAHCSALTYSSNVLQPIRFQCTVIVPLTALQWTAQNVAHGQIRLLCTQCTGIVPPCPKVNCTKLCTWSKLHPICRPHLGYMQLYAVSQTWNYSSPHVLTYLLLDIFMIRNECLLSWFQYILNSKWSCSNQSFSIFNSGGYHLASFFLCLDFVELWTQVMSKSQTGFTDHRINAMSRHSLFSVTRRSRSDESHWVSVSIDLTDVTLVSEDTYRRLFWCDPDDPDDPDESYLVMKVI